MERNQAKAFIKDVLQDKFDAEKFEFFVKNLLNDYEARDNSYSGNLIPEAFREHIASYKRIGKYTDPDGVEMDILIVQTKSVAKLERTRTALRNFVVRHLKSFEKNYALVAFYSKEDGGEDWRLSFIRIDVEQYKDDKGKVKTKDEIIPARRFSFLVGKNEDAYTAQKQLLPILTNDINNPLIEKEEDGDGSIEGAFSIEKVTDEFYEQYKELYLKLTENKTLVAALKKEKLDVPRFVKKLLGQIVFLYFLQKKGWLGVPKNMKMGEGSKRFLQNQYDRFKKDNYFKSFLRYLFYEALAKEHNDGGIKYYYAKLDCKIPFLNGGLFEADYDWEKSSITIENELFRNNEKNKAGDVGTGILDVFDRYNFTIKEDEPLEKEVAVDPEMLGKVFENMLEITERKSKGAFYTPREIVHYMCQESLIHYLDNAVNDYSKSYQPIDSDQLSLVGGSMNKKGTGKLEFEHSEINVPKSDLEIFIRNGHLVLENELITQSKGKETRAYKFQLPESIRIHAKKLDDKLSNIKICDPAIGSGAFPVGLLHEIVIARLVLNSFIQNKNHTPYYLKRHAIQECIYGVDIDTSAVDIARLRLWLSMIVDEEDYDNIEALPNLDYKVVCGNSLIGLPQGFEPRWLDELEDAKNEFFECTDEKKKKQLRENINSRLRDYLNSSERTLGYHIDFDYKLFFSEVWHEKNGFDLVIGNPPYVQIQKLDEKYKAILKRLQFDTFKLTGDLYEIFYEKGFSILNKGGHLCYITSNKWLRANYGESTRHFFLNRTNPKVLFDFGQEMVFASAIVHSNVLLSQNSAFKNQFRGCQMSKGKLKGYSLSEYFNSNAISLDYFNDEVWAISTPEMIEVRSLLEAKGKKLRKWKVNFRRGVLTGYNPAFILEGSDKKQIVDIDRHAAEIIKPILRGRDTRKYYSNFHDQWMICTFPTLKINIEHYPGIKKHLLSFDKRKLDQSGKAFINEQGEKDSARKKTKHKWFETQDTIAYYTEFAKPKIIFSEIVSEPQFYYDQKGFYPEATAFLLTGENLKWLVGFLNSHPLTVLFRIFYAGGELVGKYRYKKAFLENLPIPEPIPEYEPIVNRLVDYLTYYKGFDFEKSGDRMISDYYEAIVDALVYEIMFPEQFEKSNKKSVRYLKDLKPLPEESTDEKRIGIIKSEFERLYDPSHPVRNNVETIGNIEEVRIIREALK